MNLTSVDPPEVIRFVKQHYPEVELIKPKDSIYHIAVQKTLLPTQRIRWCCEEYKENAGAGKVTLIGIRHQESTRRAKRNEVEISSKKFSGTLEGFEQYREEKLSKPRNGRPVKGVNITNATSERTIGCISGKESLLISPIIHWTERDVWEFLNRVCRVPHCSLYDEGRRRIGCICCPMSNHRSKYQDIQRWPHVKRNWIKAIVAIRRGGGIYEKRISPIVQAEQKEGISIRQNGVPSQQQFCGTSYNNREQNHQTMAANGRLHRPPRPRALGVFGRLLV